MSRDVIFDEMSVVNSQDETQVQNVQILKRHQERWKSRFKANHK